ncbi:MAG: hypothetical protein COB30_000255 [Ectothiorhodospiraceae bacterium]|nr:hypothetical protein [Ectothiorhodospiraceae bacterium]
MKISNELSLNRIVLYLNSESLTLQRVGPANSDELNELRELGKKGLTKFLVIDASASFIAPKCVLEKLIDDFSNGDKVFSEIVDRSQQGQNLVQIYASNIGLRKSALTPAQFQKMAQEEDLILENYKNSRSR